MLSLDFKQQHPDIPWGQIIRMRHGYASVLPEILWQTAIEDIPTLKRQIEVIYNDL